MFYTGDCDTFLHFNLLSISLVLLHTLLESANTNLTNSILYQYQNHTLEFDLIFNLITWLKGLKHFTETHNLNTILFISNTFGFAE